jgi:Fe-S cluster assembly protein SufD
VYTGLIRVEKAAVNADAYQENRNLLLDDGVKAESIPELEILTDAVRCTHGATMGPVDPEQVHYLMARGVPRPDAERLIVAGFVEPALDKMPADLRGRVRQAVAAKLGIRPAEDGDGE